MKLRLCLILLLLFVVTTTVNAQQVIQLQWVEDSGNVQYDESGPYTNITYLETVKYRICYSGHGYYIGVSGKLSFDELMTYAGLSWTGNTLISSVKISLDGNTWINAKENMTF